MTKLCICQICNCGRHRCPHHPQKVINKGKQPCTLSEYANRYIPHPLEMRKSMKPSDKPMESQDPLSDKTTQRVDYHKHPYEHRYVRPAEQYVAPEGVIDPLTSYNKEYTRKQGSAAKPMKRTDQKRAPGTFEGNPTYKDDYRKWSAQPTKPIIRDQGYRPNSQPFDGQATYDREFIKHQLNPRESCKPANEAMSNNDPFAHTTGYRDDFSKKAIPPREKREKAEYKSSKAPLDGLSNYKKDYVAKEGKPMPSCKPDNQGFQSNAPLNDETTHRVDYTKKACERPYVHEPDQYTVPEGNFDFNTTHNQVYTKKPLQRTLGKKPEGRKGLPGKFDSHTNYKEDFQKWPLTARQEYKNKDAYRPTDAPFEGDPTYVRDYVRYNEPPRKSMKPNDAANISEQPFEGNTNYKTEYNKKPIPPKELREKAAYAPNKTRLDDMTNYKKDYTQKEGAKQDSCKPGHTAFRSDAPLADETTQRNDYQKWPMERPHIHEPNPYVQPEGDFDMNTTHKIAYTKKPLASNPPMKPTQRKGLPGKFDDNTNYKNDFQKWKVSDRAMPKQKAEYSAPTDPFRGSTNYQDEYHKHKMVPVRSLKPADTGVQSDAPFEGGTEYKQEYMKKNLPPCPAGVIQAGGNTGFMFTEQDNSGHKWYEKTTTSVIDFRPNSMTNTGINQQLTALSVA